MPKKKTDKQETQTSEKIHAIYSASNISSNSQKAMSLFGDKRYGEKKQDKIIYSIYEALYLLETEKLILQHKNKKLNFQDLLKKAEKQDKKAWIKYLVFRDMRQRGYIIKTALKFGADFRVYDKGKQPGQEHAKWILFPVSENENLTWHEFSAKQRVAHSTKKNLLIAVVDEEEDITFYECKWLRP